MRGKRNQNRELYGVIGLGRFGSALAQALADAGKDLLVIDRNEAKINAAAAYTENAFIVEELSRENLENCGVQNCDVVVVGIGSRIDTSILTALTVLRLGVKRVIAKATTEEQGAVLRMMGAEVVYPEHDMAVRLAKQLVAPHILENIALSPQVNIVEVRLTEHAAGKTVAQLDVRKRFGLNILAVKEGDVLTTDIQPGTELTAGSTITVIGRQEGLARFERFLQEGR